MIGLLCGVILAKQPPQLLLNVNGVGYEIDAPMNTFYHLPDVGQQVTLFTHFVVREDAQQLYGFYTCEERTLFRTLLKVNGVGPRLGLTILSSINVNEFVHCVVNNDAASLVRLPGVGKKTAERLIIEMRDKLSNWTGTASNVDGAVGKSAQHGRNPIIQDAVSALISLGYKPQEASRAVSKVDNGTLSSEEIIRRALPGDGMKDIDRIVTAEQSELDAIDRAIRPKKLTDYVGQPAVREQMEIFIQAARSRSDALDHVLVFGPPGLGKTTLAHIIANEMGVGLRQTSGPVLERPGDVAALLTNLQAHDVLFIDEIHRLSPVVEEVLYPAMEDYQLDIMIGEGPAARSIKLNLPPFTLIGATTRAGLLTSPLRDRFGIVQRLEFYQVIDLTHIIQRSATILSISIDPDAAAEIAKRSRGTPRIANRLLRRVRDYAEVKANGVISHQVVQRALDMLDVDTQGFDIMDRKLLTALIDRFSGGPVGIDSLAASISEERGTIEDVIEPFLIQQGFIMRTPRGRIATKQAYLHFGLPIPEKIIPQKNFSLLDETE